MAESDNSQVQKAYEAIRDDIISKRLLPGVPVVSSALYERLGMSRTPVREAIRRLETEGVVDVIPHKGAVVRTHTKEEILDAYEVLEALDGMLTYSIAERFRNGELTADDTKELYELVREMDHYNEENDNQNWVNCDVAFHEKLRALCKNELLVKEIERFLFQFYFIAYRHLLPPKQKEQSNIEHKEMLACIENGDAVNARNASQTQRKRMREFLRETEWALLLI